MSVCGAAGGGLLQRGVQSSGELRDGVHAGKDSERLEEAGSDEDLLLCCHCTRECVCGRVTLFVSVCLCDMTAYMQVL